MKETFEQSGKFIDEEGEVIEGSKDLLIKGKKSSSEEQITSRISLISNDPYEDSKSQFLDKEPKYERQTIKYEIKDNLMMAFLLLSSSVNFSILYIPLIILGISYIFISLKFKNAIKRKIEIFSIIYCILLIIFKGIIFYLHGKQILEYDDYSNLFHNLGIKIDKNGEIHLERFISLIGEISLILVSGISIFIGHKDKMVDFKDISFSNESFNKKIQIIIYLGYIFILINAIYNKSFLTIIYLIFYQILIILFSKNNSFKLFRIAIIVYLIFLTTHLLLINIFNIYSLQKKFLEINAIKREDKVENYYSIITMIGINYSYCHSLLIFFYEWLSYASCVLTIVLFTIAQRIFSEKKDFENIENIQEDKIKENKEKNENVFIKLKNSLLNLITNTEFSLIILTVFSLLWIYILRNFFTLGIFAFLFIAFTLSDMGKIKCISIFILIPINILTIICLNISNINGILESNDNEIFKSFAFEKDRSNLKHILAGVYFLLIMLFYNLSNKNKKNKDNIFILAEEKVRISDFDFKKTDNNNKEDNNNDIKLIDVLLKFFFDNIYIISIVVMYFISMHTINIIHFFFIIIFMLQILVLDFTTRHSKCIITLIQILFFFEYIVDITKNYYFSFFNDNFKLFQFLFSVTGKDNKYTINIYIEILCYAAIYVLYFQNKLITSKIYKEFKSNENISISNYIITKFLKQKEPEKSDTRKIHIIIFSIILEIYSYILFALFYLFCCNLEINILIGIKLIIFLLVVFIYFQNTQGSLLNVQYPKKLSYFLIVYCCINSFFVYFYQLLCLDLINLNEKIKNSENLFAKNISTVGLINYENKNLVHKLFPHFFSIFLSMLLKNTMNMNVEYKNFHEKEINEKENSDDKKIIEIKSNNNSNIIEDNLINEDSNKSDEENEQEEENEKEEQKGEKDLDNNKGEYENLYIEIQEKIKSLNSEYYSYLFFFDFPLELYCPLFILLFCYFFTYYKMSAALIAYFSIIGIIFIKMFKRILNPSKYGKNKNNNFLSNPILIHENVNKIKNERLNEIYKCITNLTLFFLFLNYFYSIIYQIKNNNCKEEQNQIKNFLTEINNDCNLENSESGKLLIPMAYILGIYNYSNLSELFSSNKLYLIIILLMFISRYIEMGRNYIQTSINQIMKKQKILLEKFAYLKIIVKFQNEIKEQKEIDEKKKEDLLELKKEYESLKKNEENAIDFNNDEIVPEISENKKLILSQVMMEIKNIFFFTKFQRPYENLIIFTITISIIFKINIWSIIYILIIIFILVSSKKNNIKHYYNLLIFLVISNIFQSILLLLNTNKNASPNMDEKISTMLRDKLSIPFYDNLFGNNYIKNGVFFGLGVSNSQVLLIWCENVLLVLVSIYLYFFGFNISDNEKDKFQKKYLISGRLPESFDKIIIEDYMKKDNKNEDQINNNLNIGDNKKEEINNKKIDKDSIIFELLSIKEYRNDISNIGKEQYKYISNVMEYNFNEEFFSLEELRKILIYLKSQKNDKENIISEINEIFINSSKNSIYSIYASDYILYLFFLNIILIIIIFILMMCPGIFPTMLVCFCFWHLFFSHFDEGRKSSLPRLIQNFIIYFLITDIFFQLITQIVLIYKHEIMSNKIVKAVLELMGFREIFDEKYEITADIKYSIGKSFCFFLAIIQKNIYFSRSFKLYYLDFLFKIPFKLKLNGIINAYIYNNNRMKEMKDNLDLKLNMERTMIRLKEKINEIKELKGNDLTEIKIEEKNNNNINIENNNNINIENNNQNNNNINIENINQNNNNEIILKEREERFTIHDENKVSSEDIKKLIKKWVEGQTFLIGKYSEYNKKAYNLETSNYAKEGHKIIKKNLIEGKNEEHIPNLFNKIDQQINKLNWPDLEKKEIKDLKAFLQIMDGIGLEELDQYYKNLKEKSEKKEGRIIIRKRGKVKVSLNEKAIDQIYLLKKSPLFIKYITKRYLLKKIFKDIVTLISHNFCWVCYLFMILNHMANASLISLFYPLSIFCYAIYQNPRPSKNYWQICYYFTLIFTIIKIIFQEIYLGSVYLFGKEGYIPSQTYGKFKLFLDYNQIGIKLYDTYKDYYLNLTLDFLVLIALIINKNILLINGLWTYNEEYYENIKEANERVFNKKERNLKDIFENKKIRIKINEKNCCERIFPRLRNEKPGKDFYHFYFVYMLIIIIYVLVYYTTMVRDKIHDKVNKKVNQFSGMTIIVVLVHIFVLMVDRVIYLRLTRVNVSYKYKYFSEEEKREITEESEKLKDINGIIYQNEEANVPLIVKFSLYIALTILSHLFIFFYIPMAGNYNIYNTTHCLKNISSEECNDFQKNYATIIFYIIYLFYLVASALQIKYGFYDVRRTSILYDMNSIHGFLNIYYYRTLPMFYPLKTIVDWTLTPTSFGVWKWIRFEGVHFAIYKIYCIKHGSDGAPVGKKVPFKEKAKCGGISSFILLGAMIFPLIAFSSLNPIGQLNNVNSALMKIYMSFIDNKGRESKILIFENNWAKSITNMSDDVWNDFGYNDSYYTKNFPREQLQIVAFYATPENTLSQFKINHILTSIVSLLDIKNSTLKSKNSRNIKCILKIENEFIRANPPEARVVNKQSELNVCDINVNETSEGCLGLKNLYNSFNKISQANNTDIMFNISGFSPILKLGVGEKPVEFGLEKDIKRNLIFKTNGKDLFEIYFDEITEDNGIEYHVLNDKILEGTFGYNFVGFYTAIVFVIGSYFARYFSADLPSLPLIESPHPEILMDICEGIVISRHLQDFRNEDYYYCVLADLLRTPELLRKMTYSNLPQFYQREKIIT